MPDTPKKDVKFWLAEIEQSGKHEQTWRKRARKVIDIYRDDSTEADVHFNILWSNVQTQRPALYSATPKPVVRRRHRQQGEVGRMVSLLLERTLTYMQDPGGSYDFDRVAEKTILDYLLPGRMVARVKYHPVLDERSREVESDELPPNTEEFSETDIGTFIFQEKYEEKVDEEVRIYHVPFDQYRQAIANCWDDVWWIAYGNNFLTKEEIIDQFGEEHADVPLTHISHQEEKDGHAIEDETRTVKKAQVWEIWDKEDRTVKAVVKGYDSFLMEIDDPLELRGFYPGPEPVLVVETPDSLIPIPEYCMYQCQAEEVNLITKRIENLVKAMKLCGFYPGAQKDVIKEMLDSNENTLIPVEDWGAITERGGLTGMIEWIPLRDVADAWQRLMTYRQTLIQSIFELTGISDIQRGATDPRETKGAQQLKASFGTRRLLPKQQDTQRFFRDLFRIQAEIVAEHFDAETIAKMSQQQLTPQLLQARELMRDDALRSFAVDIETDSTIAADEEADKQGVSEFVTAMSAFLQQTFPIVQQQPAAMEPIGKLLLWMSRKFRIARDAEDEIEEFLQSFAQLDEKPSPEQLAQKAKQEQEQAKMQMDQQKAAAELQLKQQESQAEQARKDQEVAAKIEREERMALLEERKARLEILEKEQKIKLMREEAEAKVVLSAADQQARTSQQESKAEPSRSDTGGSKADISVNVDSTPKKKKITLIKDAKGSPVGAEVETVSESTKEKVEVS